MERLTAENSGNAAVEVPVGEAWDDDDAVEFGNVWALGIAVAAHNVDTEPS